MDFFFDFLKDVFREFIRTTSAFVFHNFLFKNEKTTRRRRKLGGSLKKTF